MQNDIVSGGGRQNNNTMMLIIVFPEKKKRFRLYTPNSYKKYTKIYVLYDI